MIMRGTKITRVARVQKLIGGLETYASSKVLLLNGVPVKGTVLMQQLQAKLDLMQAVEPAREAYQRAVAAAEPVGPSLDVTIAAVKAIVGAMFGVGSEAYVAMGFAAPTRRQPSLATKLHAAVTRAATRAARATMGPQQKAAIRALVPMQSLSIAPSTPPVISNAAASTSPAQANAPASNAPASTGTSNGTPTK
jgi:hypothetical protein